MHNESQEPDGFKARWIRVSADMLEHDAFAGEPYSKHAAWLWLIANAAWKPRRFKAPNVNAMVELERGQVLAARHYLADKWQWSEKKVRNFLAFLLSQNMIEMGQSKGRFANIVTICNYDKYQTANNEKGQFNGQMRAGCGPVEGQTLTRNTNYTIVGEGAREGEVASGHGVFVNCETIRHASFTISLPAIEMATIASGLPPDEIKKICTAHALQWAAEIEGGKYSRDVVPSKIANFLASTIMREKARGSSVAAAPSAPRNGAPVSSGAAWHEKKRRNGEIILALAKGEAIPQ